MSAFVAPSGACDDAYTQVSDTKIPAISPTSNIHQQEEPTFPKLRALGKIVEKCLSDGKDPSGVCHDMLILVNPLGHLEDGQHKASSLNACMQALQEQQSLPRSSCKNRAAITATQWNNREPWETSSQLFRILQRKLSFCASHWAMLRLNGFDLEDFESPRNFRVYLTSCTASSTWKETSCTSVPK